MDEAVKNVTLALKESGRYKDTAILFMSDNGGADNDNGAQWYEIAKIRQKLN